MEIKQEVELVAKLKNFAVTKQGKLFNLYISGSHLYGWSSKDSDIDIRGSIILDRENYLGLKTPEEVWEVKRLVEYDIVLFEVKKMIGLALKGNCNILEEINAPQFYKTAEFIRLKQLINNAFGKRGIYNSYRGLAEFNYKEFIKQGRNTVKKYLYVFRGLMAGIYCLETGQIQPNMEELNKRFRIKEVDELLKIKREGTENGNLINLEEGKLDLLIKDLFDKLDEAYLKCKMPEVPKQENIDEINKYLIGLRNDN
jgi:predicted nucleotidyltransferase